MVGDLRSYVDRGNVHAYTGGLSPDPEHLNTELKRASAVSGGKPVWATEVGFHNAMRSRSRSDQSPVSERVAAIYLLRTFLEHFRSGIPRTYAYELLDEKPERAGRDPEQHFGLLRSDFSRKPAFRALRNLLDVVGPDEGTPELKPLRMGMSGPAGMRRLVLRRADGTYLVALWRLDSAWDRDRAQAAARGTAACEAGPPGDAARRPSWTRSSRRARIACGSAAAGSRSAWARARSS